MKVAPATRKAQIPAQKRVPQIPIAKEPLRPQNHKAPRTAALKALSPNPIRARRQAAMLVKIKVKVLGLKVLLLRKVHRTIAQAASRVNPGRLRTTWTCPRSRYPQRSRKSS